MSDLVSALTGVFHRHLEGDPGGAALAVFRDGRPVVEIVAGHAALPTAGTPGRPWTSDTLVPLASATKALPAATLLLQVEEGRIGLDDRIAAVWPEFGAAGKDGTTIRHLLSHRAGVVTTPRPFTVDDQRERRPIHEDLAQQPADWAAGTRHGYHAYTFGWIIDGVVERLTGSSVFDVFESRLAQPFGLDVTMRLDPARLGSIAEAVTPTTADVAAGVSDPAYADFNAAMADPGSLLYRATLAATATTFEEANDPAVLCAPDPSGGGHGSALGLARLYALLATGLDGGAPLLSRGLVDEARRPHADGLDEVLRLRTRWGAGFMLPGGPMWMAAGPGAFGQAGASGSLGFADPDRGIAFAYTPNTWRGFGGGTDQRAEELVAALYRHL